MTNEIRFAQARDAYLGGNYGEALAVLNGMMNDGPQARPLMLLGETLAKLDMPGDAAFMCEQAAALAPDLALVALRRAGQLYLQAGQEDQAQLAALKVFSSAPDDPVNAYTLIRVFMKTGETALVDALKNKLVASDDPEHLRLAVQLIGADLRNENNLVLFSKLRTLFPDDPFVRASLMGFAREFCDLTVQAREETALLTDIEAGNTAAFEAESPHYNLMWCENEAWNRRAANIRLETPFSAATQKRRRQQPHTWAEKLRVGYLSSDFWDDHATMRLLQSVLTAHDPARFDITLFCYTPERFVAFDGGNRRNWGRIVSIADMTDDEAEVTIRKHEIDILVDLKGHTANSRASILNRMAAPVQVAWLGFPGSVVNVDSDYILGDAIVLPDSSTPHYHEKFCRLPESYQPNDPVHRPLPPALTRAELGLPDNAFLFASFNSQRKLNRRTLTLWAEVLRRSTDSLLWIMCDGDLARDNILRFFAQQRIGAPRILFAGKTGYERHIARAQAADLCLDSFPCNGHTTTSDLLWAGVPVLTAQGKNFASRVSESLLNAMGINELVAGHHDGFVELAVALAADRARLADIRARLNANRFRAPLFDAERFCRHLEAAYDLMAARARSGKEPDHIDVAALPPRQAQFMPERRG